MREKIIFPARELPVVAEADLVVCGGGPAGIAAAVAAGRRGISVIVIEQGGCCGGMTSRGLLPSIISMTDRSQVLAGGICREFVDRIARDMNLPAPDYNWQNIHPESAKKIADEMLEEAGVTVFYDSAVTGCLCENGRILAVECSFPGGNYAVKGTFFADCTGDGTLSAFAGADFEYGDADGKVMAPTLCVMYDNVRYPDGRTGGLGRSEWAKALEEGRAPLEERHFVGFFRTGEKIGTGNLGHMYETDVLDVYSRSRSWKTGRKLAEIYRDFYRGNVEGFQDISLAQSADMMGVRESRRVVGEYRLTREDYAARRHFDDEIGSFAYPIDIHSAGRDPEQQANVEKNLTASCYRPGENYGIPYRVLLPKKTENLLVAGRCVSSDRTMQSSLRVVPGCMITGEAAGTAAALSVSHGCGLRELDIRELQKVLKEHGAVIRSGNEGECIGE